MRKIVVALAVAGGSGWVAAQSSVTMYGILDTGITHGSGSVADRTSLSSGNNAGGRLGVRGVEDLGGGLSASFVLEAGVTTDDGAGVATNPNNQASAAAGTPALQFTRRSTLSLQGRWGELRAGRDLAAHYLNKLVVDPFSNIGVGAAQPLAGSKAGPTGVRVSNMIGYYLASKQGFYGSAQYFMGENLRDGRATAHAGTGAGARLGYLTGRRDAAIGYGKTEFARTATAGDVRTYNVALRYEAAPGIELGAGYYVDRVDASTPVKARGYIAGVRVMQGSHEFKAALSRFGSDAGTQPTTTKLALGYVHWLSKRTGLYGTYARLRNTGGATAALNQSVTGPDRSSSGFDLGVRHSF
jgi:predicted porin